MTKYYVLNHLCVCSADRITVVVILGHVKNKNSHCIRSWLVAHSLDTAAGSAVVQSPDELLVRPGGGGGPRAEVAPPRVHGLHGLAAAEEAAAEAGVSVVHDAVAVVPAMAAHYYL